MIYKNHQVYQEQTIADWKEFGELVGIDVAVIKADAWKEKSKQDDHHHQTNQRGMCRIAPDKWS